MSIQGQAHYKAMKDLIELMAIASALALIADAFWIIRDMYCDAVTPGRLFVMVLLDSALALQTYALIMFHGQLAMNILNVIKLEKKKICKLKAKHAVKQVRKGGK